MGIFTSEYGCGISLHARTTYGRSRQVHALHYITTRSNGSKLRARSHILALFARSARVPVIGPETRNGRFHYREIYNGDWFIVTHASCISAYSIVPVQVRIVCDTGTTSQGTVMFGTATGLSISYVNR